VHVVGYSMGGAVAAAFAATYPARTLSLALVAPVGTTAMALPRGLGAALALAQRALAAHLTRPASLVKQPPSPPSAFGPGLRRRRRCALPALL
jgi:pimeloyl-ACP methyl ester carboxylesterase